MGVFLERWRSKEGVKTYNLDVPTQHYIDAMGTVGYDAGKYLKRARAGIELLDLALQNNFWYNPKAFWAIRKVWEGIDAYSGFWKGDEITTILMKPLCERRPLKFFVSLSNAECEQLSILSLRLIAQEDYQPTLIMGAELNILARKRFNGEPTKPKRIEWVWGENNVPLVRFIRPLP